MTELKSVSLSGTYRNLKAKATFARRGKTWELRIVLGKKSRLFVLDRHAKPCWTVAMDFMAEMAPSKPKPSRPREQVKPELKLYA